MNQPEVNDQPGHARGRAVLRINLVKSRAGQAAHAAHQQWQHFVQSLVSELDRSTTARRPQSPSSADKSCWEVTFDQAGQAAQFGLALLGRFEAGRPSQGAVQPAGLRISGMLSGEPVPDTDDIVSTDDAGPVSDFLVSPEFADQLTPLLDPEVVDLGPTDLAVPTSNDRRLRVQAVAPAPEVLQQDLRADAHRACIMVLPFYSRLQTPGGEVVGRVLVDELITALSPNPGLQVISHQSSHRLAGRPDADAMLERLPQVRFLVRGSFIANERDLRVFIHLVDARQGETLWSHQVDADLGDVLAGDGSMGAEVAQKICQGLLVDAVSRVQHQPLATIESFSLLFAAVSQMHSLRRQSFEQAEHLLLQLSQRCPRAAEPLAWLAKWHVLKVAQGWSDDPAGESSAALAATARALDLEPGNSLALAIDGLVHVYLLQDLDTAGHRYQQALQVNPNQGLARLFRAAWHAYRDEGILAVRDALDAQRLSPLDPLRYFYDNFTSTALLSTDDYRGAIEFGQRSLRSNASHGPTLRVLAIAQWLGGDPGGARETVGRLMRLEPGFTAGQFARRYPGVSSARVDRYTRALRDAGVPS